MKMYIMTRSTSVDYVFLAKSPSESWWKKYEKWTSFEYPSVILICEKGKTKLYLCGIPSQRKDCVKTPIRYTLVIENISNYLKIIKILNNYLNEIEDSTSNIPESSELGNHLDKEFLQEYVDDFLSVKGKVKIQNPDKYDEISDKIKKALDHDFFTGDQANYHGENWWVGGINNCITEWMAFLKDSMEKNKNYIAAYFNLADKQSIIPLIDKYESGAILINKNIGIEKIKKSIIMPHKRLKNKVKKIWGSFTCLLIMFFLTGLGWSYFGKTDNKIISVDMILTPSIIHNDTNVEAIALNSSDFKVNINELTLNLTLKNASKPSLNIIKKSYNIKEQWDNKKQTYFIHLKPLSESTIPSKLSFPILFPKKKEEIKFNISINKPKSS